MNIQDITDRSQLIVIHFSKFQGDFSFTVEM